MRLFSSTESLRRCPRASILNRLLNDSNIYRILSGFSVLVGLCIFGMRQTHRSFMHSFLALFLFTSCVEVIFPTVAPYFAIGFASHLMIDLINNALPIMKGIDE